MYDFHDSTDTLKFWTENGLLIKLFCFSSDFDETWWSCSYSCVLQFHQVASKSDEKQKSFTNSLFFCSEFQSARICFNGINAIRYYSKNIGTIWLIFFKYWSPPWHLKKKSVLMCCQNINSWMVQTPNIQSTDRSDEYLDAYFTSGYRQQT